MVRLFVSGVFFLLQWGIRWAAAEGPTLEFTMRALLPFLVFSLACQGEPGADGTPGVAGAEGAEGPAGAEGAPGADGADGSAFASASLAPGDYLALEHGLGAGDKHYEAQFSWNGVVYDHRDFPTLLPGHAVERSWSVSVPEWRSYYDDVSAVGLSSGDLALAFEGCCNLDFESPELWIQIVEPDGTLVADLPSLVENSVGDRTYNDPRMLALEDGGFVLVVETTERVDGQYVYGAQLDQYDATGTLVSSEQLFDNPEQQIYKTELALLPGYGFAVAYAGNDESTGEDLMELVFYDNAGGSASYSLDSVVDDTVRLAGLPDGRLAVLCELTAPSGQDSVGVMFMQADGTVESEVILHENYITDDLALVYGSQDTLLVAAESGGPDLPFYAVLGADGSVIQPATALNGIEHDAITAGAFPDGDFLFMLAEDESNAPMTWVVDAQGALLRPMVVGDITVVPDDSRGAFITSTVDNTVGHFVGSYDSDIAPRYTVYTKGLLELRVESEDEVRLYNETPNTLDVTLAAHSAP